MKAPGTSDEPLPAANSSIRSPIVKFHLGHVVKKFLSLFLPLAAFLGGLLALFYSFETKHDRRHYEERAAYIISTDEKAVSDEFQMEKLKNTQES